MKRSQAMPKPNRLAIKICNNNTPEQKYRHLGTPGLLIGRELTMKTHYPVACIKAFMFKACPVMKGHHEVRKTSNLWCLSKR